MAPLIWRHHTLIQALLSRGPLKEDDLRSIFSQITGKTSGIVVLRVLMELHKILNKQRKQQDQKLFNEYLGKINSELAYVQLELRACRNQYDGRVYYGVVNNVSDDQSKLGTKYTVPQIAFYKGIVEAIIQDAEAEGCILSTATLNIKLETQVPGATDSQGGAVQIPLAFKNFSMLQKEKSLDQLVKDRWLCATPEGKIGLGVRSFLDLRGWFRSNEVPACEVCNEAAIKAQLCPNESCNVRLHSYCLQKKFSGQRVEKVCSGCGAQLHGSTAKEEFIEERNNANDHSQNSQPSSKRSRRSFRAANAESDTQGYGSPVSFNDMVETKRVTRNSTRLSSN